MDDLLSLNEYQVGVQPLPSDPPPPYTPEADAEADAFLDNIIRAGRPLTVNVNRVERECRLASIKKEADRVRNLLVFTLSVDYQCIPDVRLSASDHYHFKSLYNTLRRLHATNHSSQPSAVERSQLAPYFWKYLYEPCTELEIPTEILLIAIGRMLQFLTWDGKYKGCCFGVLQLGGLRTLASKLYLDRNVVIPAVIENGLQRERLLHGVSEIQDLYFHDISGFDGSTFRTNGEHDWDCLYNINYEANERGLSYERLYIAATRGCLSLTRLQLTLLVKKCVSGIFQRCGRGSDAPSQQYQRPKLWRLHQTFHAPDFIEDRDKTGCGDA